MGFATNKIIYLVCLLFIATDSYAALVRPQETLEILFTIPSDPSTNGSITHPIDTLGLTIDLNTQAIGVSTSVLFNGSDLLGLHSVSPWSSSSYIFYWTDNSSNFNINSLTPTLDEIITHVDLNSLIDRSIQGKIQLQFSDTVDFNKITLSAGNGQLSGSVTVSAGQNVVVNSVAVVPLPSAFYLLISALLGLSIKHKTDRSF